jgi:hypothetical protein
MDGYLKKYYKKITIPQKMALSPQVIEKKFLKNPQEVSIIGACFSKFFFSNSKNHDY